MQKLSVRVFTDPFCPYAYSAEPTRWRLQWLFGEQLEWRDIMIVLSGFNNEVSKITPKIAAEYKAKLATEHGMPINSQLQDRVQVSLLACTNYVAIRENAPHDADAALRALRVASMDNKSLNDQENITSVLVKAGLDLPQLTDWVAAPQTLEQLRADALAARNPGTHAQAFAHKLSRTSTDVIRYSAPSYVLDYADKHAELPGFWLLAAYEAIIGNLAPDLIKRDDPASVQEILAWAKTPLATVEIAVIYNKPVQETRDELEAAGASFSPLGSDGFWTL